MKLRSLRPVLPVAHGESFVVPALDLARDAFNVFTRVHGHNVDVTGVLALIGRAVGNIHADEVTLQLVVRADYFLVEVSRH